MSRLYPVFAFLMVAVLGLAAATVVLADSRSSFKADLGSYEETPAISSIASGHFEARIVDDTTIEFTLSYADTEAPVTQAHVHFGQRGVLGGVSAFLCGGSTKPACPPSPATVTGTITAADVIGPTAQGIAAGEFAELLRAMRAGVTYANVHSTKFPGGEIRGQLGDADQRN